MPLNLGHPQPQPSSISILNISKQERRAGKLSSQPSFCLMLTFMVPFPNVKFGKPWCSKKKKKSKWGWCTFIIAPVSKGSILLCAASLLWCSTLVGGFEIWERSAEGTKRKDEAGLAMEDFFCFSVIWKVWPECQEKRGKKPNPCILLISAHYPMIKQSGPLCMTVFTTQRGLQIIAT